MIQNCIFSPFYIHEYMARIALVRKPGDAYPKCVSNHPQKHNLNLFKVQEQHQAYCQTLEDLGLELIYLQDISNHPDSCFVEDTTVIHKKKAVICRMGEITRRGEENSVEEILNQYFGITKISAPGTVEGGDVVHFKEKMISGITQRTNIEGVKQLESAFDIPIEKIVDTDIIHLKSYFTGIDEDLIIVTSKYARHLALEEYEKIIVPKNEEYAANALTINGTVIIPEGFPRIKEKLADFHLDVVTLNVSEFQKCEGALTCLSIIF
ncbi:MAG: dimethylarginine dimethylaminohydrolase family protein [Candidatus Hodarchaeales archaeon]